MTLVLNTEEVVQALDAKGYIEAMEEAFAHRDIRNDVDHWFSLAAVSPDALFKLHDISEETLNLLSYAHDRSSYVSAKLREPSDFQQMLGDLASMRLPPIKPMQRSRGKRG